jgi:molybdate transport system substrate-binding protein
MGWRVPREPGAPRRGVPMRLVTPLRLGLPARRVAPLRFAVPGKRVAPLLLVLAVSSAWAAGCSDAGPRGAESRGADQGGAEQPGTEHRGAGGGERGGGDHAAGEPIDRTPVDGAAGALLVLAASDLPFAFEEMVALYESQTGERVQVVLGSTGNLAAQIRHGAPADLFFAANELFLDGLVEAGHVIAESRTAYAIGRLALVAPPGRPPPTGLSELADPRYEVVAIANPEHAPYGMAARDALQSAGLWEALRPRLVLGENIAHAMQFVRTGNADAGIVALGLVLGRGEAYPHTLLDAALHAPLRQSAGVVAGSERAGRAARFLEFVTSDVGRELLRQYGFEEPDVSPLGAGLGEASGDPARARVLR